MPERLRAPVLQVRRLGFAYPDQAAPFVDLCADLPTGVTLLHGEIGSGTTTLLRLLAGELLGSGDLTPHGRRFGDNPAACLQGVCALDPRDEAFDALTPARLMTAICSVERGQDEAAWQHDLVDFGLAAHLAKPPYGLSAGSRRKAGLAVALSAGCALTPLDEVIDGACRSGDCPPDAGARRR